MVRALSPKVVVRQSWIKPNPDLSPAFNQQQRKYRCVALSDASGAEADSYAAT